MCIISDFKDSQLATTAASGLNTAAVTGAGVGSGPLPVEVRVLYESPLLTNGNPIVVHCSPGECQYFYTPEHYAPHRLRVIRGCHNHVAWPLTGRRLGCSSQCLQSGDRGWRASSQVRSIVSPLLIIYHWRRAQSDRYQHESRLDQLGYCGSRLDRYSHSGLRAISIPVLACSLWLDYDGTTQ